MIWILISIILLVILQSIFRAPGATNPFDEEHIWKSIGAILVSFAVFVCGSSITGAVITPEYVEESSVEIASLEMDKLTEGSFTLGSGSVYQEPNYFYYARTNHGGYKMEWVPVSNSVIYEHPDNTGRIVTLTPYLSIVLWTIDIPDDRFEIHIPEGSIIREYSPNIN